MVDMLPATSDADAAIELAKQLLMEAKELQTPAERRQQAELDRMIGNDADKATLIEMTDQAFRTHTPARVADQLTHLLDVQGIPRFFSPIEQAMLRGFQAFGEFLPGVSVPLVKEQMRKETANVILPAEPDVLAQHLASRQQHGVSMNVNLLGEALLGDRETRARMEAYTEVLRMPEVRCLSVKLTTLYSHVSGLARRQTVSIASDRLERLYRVANRQIDPATGQGKFVYLDMEEYRDLHLTADVLRQTLDRDGLEQTAAGIALQAYVPDSYAVMRELIAWSRQRVESGGRALTIRLVKGANMEMERVDASIGGYEPAPFSTKLETDANYKRMLWELLQASQQSHLRVGIASHNLFDIALAMIWIDRLGCGDAVQFEMLEGMANHQRRAITARDAPMLLYAPACRKADFLHSIGYLIRRLDENTGPENFLRHSYRLAVGMPEFDRLAESFRRSLAAMGSVDQAPRRSQDRRCSPDQPIAANHWREFANEPDTDWSLNYHSHWIEGVLHDWRERSDDHAPRITPVTATDDVSDTTDWLISYDVSRPERVSCHCQWADRTRVDRAVSVAFQTDAWRDRTLTDRHRILRDVAQLLRERRGDLIAGMICDAGKTVAQADPEISEAIDFCEFYPLSLQAWMDRKSIRVQPRGVVAVITPWNFPLAIPCGGIAAALAVGNPVLLKPARETLLPAWQLCHAFWDAGVPKEMLQFVPCDDSVAEACLVKDPRIDTVVLTGGTSTAKRMLSVRPDLHLLAETGGKNATIVSALADRDLAIKHVVSSAFGHSGQKCSATSLLLLEDEVFDDPEFRERLADAVQSLHAGSAWDLHTDVTPLVCQPNDELTRGLKELEDDESWLVTPEHVGGHPTLYRPGVKWNVRPGSFSHQTELFGPVLSVMRYSRLEEAISIVRSTGYGLTSGLESLDDREIELWKQTIRAGNLYINRPTTGAIVLRQPFGGVGMSAYGPGVKAGGPHYVLALSRIENPADDEHDPSSAMTDSEPHGGLERLAEWIDHAGGAPKLTTSQRNRIDRAIASQRAALDDELMGEHDTFQLTGQDNLRRYRNLESMVFRIHADDAIDDAIIAVSAAVAVGTPLTISIPPDIDGSTETVIESLADWLPGMIHPLPETSDDLISRMIAQQVGRLRCISPLDESVAATCGEAFVTVIREPVLTEGAVECLRYVNEQSISHDYHRYGNLGRRAGRR